MALLSGISVVIDQSQRGITSVQHTWGHQMQHHPHVHYIVPAVGYDSRTGGLVHPTQPDEFLVHFKPLAARFRNRIRIALQSEHRELYNSLSQQARRALGPTTTWNVQLQPAGTGKTAIRYLARYVHRSAFDPSRLLGYDKSARVRLRWTCSNTGKQGILALTPHEFIRRWLLRVLPKGFTRIRHYGFLSSAAIKTRKRIRWLLGCREITPTAVLPKPKSFPCPNCGGDLQLVRRYPAELIALLRGPPYPHDQPKLRADRIDFLRFYVGWVPRARD